MVNDGVKRSKVTKEYGILPGTLSKWIQSSKCRKDDTDEAKSLSNMYNDIDNEMRSGEESERNISENVSDVDADDVDKVEEYTEDDEMNGGEAENDTDKEIEDEDDGDEMRGGEEDADAYESEDGDDTEDGEMNCGEAENDTVNEIEDEDDGDEMRGGDEDTDEYESEDEDDTEDGEMNCGEAENVTEDDIEDEDDEAEMRGGDEDTDEYESEDEDDGMIGGEIEKNKQITNKKYMNCRLTKTKIFEKCIAQFFKDIFHNVPDFAQKISKPPITKKPEPDLMQMKQMHDRRKKWKRMWEISRRKRRKRRGKYIYV